MLKLPEKERAMLLYVREGIPLRRAGRLLRIDDPFDLYNRACYRLAEIMEEKTVLSRIAFTGPIGAGKTTLCEALKETHMHINFTDRLKELLAETYKAAGLDISVERIKAEKEKFRGHLQEFGKIIRYDVDSSWILEILKPWEAAGRPPATFDNVRTPAQALLVKRAGFTIVRLNLPKGVQRGEATPEQRRHPVEQPLPSRWVDIELDASKPVPELIEELKREVPPL
jgi:hypothetical protein